MNIRRRTGKRESRDSPRWARSFNTEVLSLSCESDNDDISASNLLMAETVGAYCWRVDSPVSVPLKIPPIKLPSEAFTFTGIRLRLLVAHFDAIDRDKGHGLPRGELWEWILLDLDEKEKSEGW